VNIQAVTPLPSAVSAALSRAAAEDQKSAVALAQRLVQVPSRGGIDPYDPVIDLVMSWLAGHGLAARRLRGTGGTAVGLACDVPGAHPGPRYVLDACLDTAPFGDPSLWRHPPTSGVIEEGWLHGRGSADSKAAVAIFAHIAARLLSQANDLHGTLTLLFDLDEHTGGFGGARQYFATAGSPRGVAGVMIGYPGTEELIIGSRGVQRAEVTVRGQSEHSGSSHPARRTNAAEKAAHLVHALARHQTPAPIDQDLGLASKLTVTAVHGGEGYTIVPDRCTINVDVRLTTEFDDAAASRLLQEIVTSIDREWPETPPTEISLQQTWPAYKLGEETPIRTALTTAASRHLPRLPQPKVSGPSNIGNYLAQLGIAATAGLGVRYEGLHGTDERIEIATVPLIQATYHEAVLTLLGFAA
jgi:succinyl-diaminopimelate desuccinylase